MVNLSVRSIVSKCLGKSVPLSIQEDLLTVDGIPAPNSLKSALQFVRQFRCPPAAPTNLRITSIGEDSLSVAWDDNADNEAGFRLSWTGRRPFSQHDDGSRTLNQSNRESYTISGLFPNYEYCVRVRAFNDGGNSSDSDEVCATIPDSPPPTQGWSQVNLFNCHTAERSVNIWMRDITAGSGWSEQSSISSQNEGITCPSNSAEPFVVSFSDDHLYELVAVDTGSPACGGNNDPQTVGCRRWAVMVQGNPEGPSTQIVIT